MTRNPPNLPTPATRPIIDDILTRARTSRREPGNRTAGLEYRILSRGLSLPDPDAAADAICSGDQAAINVAIDWLELDVFCLFSGYAKQRLMRALARTKLSSKQAARIRTTLLAVIARGPRMEFRDARRLAGRVATPSSTS